MAITSTDNAHMGRSGHPALIIGISAAAVLAVGTGVALTRGDTPVAHADTRLGPVRDASVVSVAGLSRPARAGTLIAAGEVVTTGRDGDAELLTKGRATLLGSNAALAVRDGAHQQLRTGTAVIDAQEGPGLTLDIAGDTLVVPAGSATEADRAAAVRIGSLAGPASVTNGSGRHLSVAALWQVILNGDALPSAPTPLHLSYPRLEARAVPELVADNIAMKALARGINSTGSTTAHAVEAAWTGTIVPRGAGVTRSDQVLPVAIADATAPAGGTPQQRYDRVVGWRSDGGSWGVVIHLLSARAAQIATTLHSLQQTERPGTVGKVSANGLGTSPLGSSPPALGHHHAPPPPSNPLPTTTPTSPPPGGGGVTPPPTPKPTRSTSLLGGLVGTVGTVLNDLLSILPQGTPSTKHVTTATDKPNVITSTTVRTPTPTPSPTASLTPTPSPTASGLVGGLLGGLVGGLTHQ